MDGILNILKPPGMTSHDVVLYIRKLTGEKKVGHAGTLDPNVAGVLPLFLGKATRLTEYFLEKEKHYRGEITFGLVSDTQDIYGRIVFAQPYPNLSKEQICRAIKLFQGEIFQIPPMVSAVRHKGKKLYELARDGLEVQRMPRKVRIENFSVVEWSGLSQPYPSVIFDVRCSKGTYVRTLCHDLGQVLGCGAVLSCLIRTCSGPFKIEDSVSFEMLKKKGVEKFLLPLDYGLEDRPQVTVDKEKEKMVVNGRTIELLTDKYSLQKDEYVRIYSGEGIFLGIYQYRIDRGKGKLFPHKVFV